MATTVDQGWVDLRRRERAVVLSWLAFIPIAVFCGILSQHFHHDWIFIVGGVLSFAGMFAAGIYLYAFKCPRCGSLFFIALYPRSWRAAFGGACSHCGLHACAGRTKQPNRPNQSLEPTAGRRDAQI